MAKVTPVTVLVPLLNVIYDLANNHDRDHSLELMFTDIRRHQDNVMSFYKYGWLPQKSAVTAMKESQVSGKPTDEYLSKSLENVKNTLQWLEQRDGLKFRVASEDDAGKAIERSLSWEAIMGWLREKYAEAKPKSSESWILGSGFRRYIGALIANYMCEKYNHPMGDTAMQIAATPKSFGDVGAEILDNIIENVTHNVGIQAQTPNTRALSIWKIWDARKGNIRQKDLLLLAGNLSEGQRQYWLGITRLRPGLRAKIERGVSNYAHDPNNEHGETLIDSDIRINVGKLVHGELRKLNLPDEETQRTASDDAVWTYLTKPSVAPVRPTTREEMEKAKAAVTAAGGTYFASILGSMATGDAQCGLDQFYGYHPHINAGIAASMTAKELGIDADTWKIELENMLDKLNPKSA